MYLPLSFSLLPFSTSPLSFYLLSMLLSEPLSSPYLFHNIISSLLLFPLSISPLSLSIFSLRYPSDFFFPAVFPSSLSRPIYTYLLSIVLPSVPVLFLPLNFLLYRSPLLAPHLFPCVHLSFSRTRTDILPFPAVISPYTPSAFPSLALCRSRSLYLSGSLTL